MKILVACEYSGVVRTAFAKKGINAWSCDLLPSLQYGNHIVGDAIEVANSENWDALIAFPPCTYLTYAGNRHWEDVSRTMQRIKAAEFFMKLYSCKIKHICIENPQGIMSKLYRSPDQVIHPYYFGDNELKRTCLWLKGLPKLKYSLVDNLFEKKTASEKPKPTSTEINKVTGKKKNRYFTDSLINNNPKSQIERSLTFKGIAEAMAEQWVGVISG